MDYLKNYSSNLNYNLSEQWKTNFGHWKIDVEPYILPEFTCRHMWDRTHISKTNQSSY